MSERTESKPPAEPKKVGVGNATPCKHLRKQLIAKDEDAEYWECFDCGEIFEPGEDGGVVNIDGSLSDA
jgi:hypothetical protein